MSDFTWSVLLDSTVLPFDLSQGIYIYRSVISSKVRNHVTSSVLLLP